MVGPLIIKRRGSPDHKFPTRTRVETPYPIGQFVSNGSSPQLVDYSFVAGCAFVVASAITPQSNLRAAEYHYGIHAQAIHQAETLKSTIWESARTPPATASLRTIWAAPQFDPSIGPLAVWESQLAGGRSPVIGTIVGGPLQVDLTQQAWIEAPSPPRQGPVPPLTGAAPQLADLTQQAIFDAPLPATQGAAPPFTKGAPQTDPSQIQPEVWAPQPAPPIPSPAARAFTIPPQSDPSQLAADIWSPTQASPTTPRLTASEYVWGTHAATLAYAESVKNKFFLSQPAPVVVAGAIGKMLWGAPQNDLTQPQGVFETPPLGGGQGALIPVTFGAPQDDPSQVAANIWESQRAAAAPTPGPISKFFALPPQGDPSQIPASVWESLQAAPTAQRVTAASYVWGTHAIALSAAEGLKSSFFHMASGGVVVTPKPIVSFVQTFQQQYDFTLQATITPAADAAPPFDGEVGLYGAPQTDPSQISARVFPSVATPAPVVSYGLRTLYGAPQTDPAQLSADVFSPTITVTYGLRSIYGTPQADPSQIAAVLFPVATPTPPIGRVPPFSWATPQYDLTLQGVVFPSVQIGTTPIVPVITPQPSTIGGVERWTIQIPQLTKKKKFVFKRNTENLDRADLEDIVALIKAWLDENKG